MKYKSQILAQASGSFGGNVASRNKGGEYMRRRALPTNPRTALQVAVRTAFGTLSQFYGQVLSDAQRAAWSLYGANVLIPDRLGDPRQQSGLNAYVRSNTPRIQAELSIVNDAPVIFALGTTPLYSPTLAGSPGLRTLTALILNPDQYGADDQVLVYLGRPQGPGVGYFKGPYRFAGVAAASSGSVLIQLPSAPYQYANGQRIFIRVTASHADGRYSKPGDLSLIADGMPSSALSAAAPAAAAAAPGDPAPAKQKRVRLVR